MLLCEGHLGNLGRIYLADTFVVKETHWLTKVRGVEPVMSSHWAGVVPPETQTLDLLPKPSRLVTKCFVFIEKKSYDRIYLSKHALMGKAKTHSYT